MIYAYSGLSRHDRAWRLCVHLSEVPGETDRGRQPVQGRLLPQCRKSLVWEAANQLRVRVIGLFLSLRAERLKPRFNVR
jgi:hypothetical protein